jgi:hypothetical protein
MAALSFAPRSTREPQFQSSTNPFLDAWKEGRGASGVNYSGAPSGVSLSSGQYIPAFHIGDWQDQYYTPGEEAGWDSSTGDGTLAWRQASPESWGSGFEDKYTGDYYNYLHNVNKYFPQWDNLNPNNWRFNTTKDGRKQLLVKTNKDTGEVVEFERQGDWWVPKLTGASAGFDTNAANRARNIGLGSVLAAGIGGIAAGYGVTAPAGLDKMVVNVGGGMGSIGATGTAQGAAWGGFEEGILAGTAAGPASTGVGSGVIPAGITEGGMNFTVGDAAKVVRQGADLLKGINSLFGGGETRSDSRSGTSTKQTQLSPEAIMEIIRKYMEDPNSGMQSIMGPGAAAGTFNGSNQALFLSNLMARAGAAAALAGAPTTETVNSSGNSTTDQQTFLEELLKKWF